MQPPRLEHSAAYEGAADGFKERAISVDDPLRKSPEMWLYGFIRCPPRHAALEFASAGVPQAKSSKALRSNRPPPVTSRT